MNHIEEFNQFRSNNLTSLSADLSFQENSRRWLEEAMEKNYAYNFDWLGRPIIQLPQDIVAIQELIWKCQPDLIIETGIAHGGSLILSASIMALRDYGQILKGAPKSPTANKVIGIDIEIRPHNRKAIEDHPLSSYIQLIEGSSTSNEVHEVLSEIVSKHSKVMVFLDSNHTHQHVLEELNLYSKYVSYEFYLVVFDTFVENLTKDIFPNRPWSVGNNPMTAVHEFLNSNEEFQVDYEIEVKLGMTVAPFGYLRRKRISNNLP